MKLALALLLLATPAFADGFGYQAHQAPGITSTFSAPSHGRSYGYRSGHGRRHHSHHYLPRRETTTVTRDGNRTRIDTRRYYRDGGTARMKTSSGAWSRAR